MSSKTKIVVLHMKEIIYTAVFVILGILLIILLAFMFSPKQKNTINSSEFVCISSEHIRETKKTANL